MRVLPTERESEWKEVGLYHTGSEILWLNTIKLAYTGNTIFLDIYYSIDRL